MVVQKTPRLGLEKYSEGSDPHPPRTKFNSEREVLDAMVALAVQGVTTARPAAGIVNRLYWDTTVKRLYWDDGAVWNEITTNGGGGTGQPISPGVEASEGSSGRSARADHTHLLALATAAVDGAMSKADKAKLDGATSAPSANTLAMRDANGRTQVSSPADSTDTANKGYVDTQVGTRAASNHTHSWDSISGKPSTFSPSAHNHTAAQTTSGVFSTSRLPYAGSSDNGIITAAAYNKLQASASVAYVNGQVAKLPDAIARGTTAVSNVLAGNVHNGYFDFPPGKFTSTPQVFLQSTHSKLTPGIGSITTDRAYFTIANNSDGATGGASILHWLAVQ